MQGPLNSQIDTKHMDLISFLCSATAMLDPNHRIIETVFKEVTVFLNRKQNQHYHEDQQKGRKLVEIKDPTNVKHS